MEVWYVSCVFVNVVACVKIFPFCFLCETFVCKRNDSDVFFYTQEKSGSDNCSICMLFGGMGGNLGKCHIDFIFLCVKEEWQQWWQLLCVIWRKEIVAIWSSGGKLETSNNGNVFLVKKEWWYFFVCVRGAMMMMFIH